MTSDLHFFNWCDIILTGRKSEWFNFGVLVTWQLHIVYEFSLENGFLLHRIVFRDVFCGQTPKV